MAFLSFTVTTYLRFRDLETRYTRLARRLALDEAERDFPPDQPRSPQAPESPAGTPSQTPSGGAPAGPAS